MIKKSAFHHGYILLELMITMLISSALAMGLFSTLFQLQRALKTTDYYADVYGRATVVYRQFERDLSGVFVPHAAEIKKEKEQKKEPAVVDKKTGAIQQNAKQTDAEKDKKPLTKIFYAENKQKMVQLFSCITCNPLQVYWGDKVGAAKPRIARVVYRLVKQKEEPVSYKLVRQEAYDPLDFDAFKPKTEKGIRELEVIDGIRSLNFSYLVAIEKKEEEKQVSPTMREKHYEYQTFDRWDWSDEERKQKKIDRQYPDLIAVTLDLWDDRRVESDQFNFSIPVGDMFGLTFAPEEPVKKKKKHATKKSGAASASKTNTDRERLKREYVNTMNKIASLKDRTSQLQGYAGRRVRS